MLIPFHKMHGAGNDFVIVDARGGLPDLTSEQIAALSDRRTGIGCDQFITLEAASPGADVFMRIRNPDGGEAGACGNATRCVTDLLFRDTGARHQIIRTLAGDLPAEMLEDGRVTVDMGPARLDWQDIPLARAMDTLHLDLPGDPVAASMGNPHVTFFVPDAEASPVTQDGPRFEHDPLFPDRANIGVAHLLAPDRLRVRVWERGAGLTRACGSGACAAAVNAHRRGLTGRRVTVVMDGGALDIDWREDGHVLMTGPVATSFTGQVEL